MPSRIVNWAGKNNRSQHNLVGSTAAEDSSSQAAAGPGTAGVSSAAASPQNPQSTPTAGTANTPSASPNPAFSSSGESFQQSQQPPPPPPPHLVNIYASPSGVAGPSPQLQHSNSVTGPHGAFDSRTSPRDQQHDFTDPVTRSQSHRYPQISPISTQLLHHNQQQQQQQQQQKQQQQQLLQQQQLNHQQHHQHQPHLQHHPPGSASAEDLSVAHGVVSTPITSPSQPLFSPQQQQQHQPQQQQQAPPPQPAKAKQSTTRKLIKIIRGDHPSQAQQNSYNSSPPLNRRNSKRISLPPAPPPSIRTALSQVSHHHSQVSLSEQQQIDWQNQAPPSQPSPLQGVGDFRESYVIDGSDQELHLQNPHDSNHQHPTIRPVPPSESDSSPYSADDIGYRQHQGHIQHQSQGPPDIQHQQQQHQHYGQAIFGAAPHQQLSPHQHQQQQQQQQQHQPQLQLQHPHQQQYKFTSPQQLQYQGSFTGHLENPQQQNPETVSQLSQLSHESPATDSDQRSVTNIQAQTSQASPAVIYPHQSQDNPGRPNPPPGAQPQTPQQHQSMAPPTGGPPPRRSQEAEKGLREGVQPPAGPPPSYRQSQNPPNSMNPLPQPPNASGQNPNFRSSNVPDPRQQQFEGSGDIQGRNSPQPPSSERGGGGGEDPDKAFKELLTKYKNVKRLYFDGKKEIEHLSSQVEQLQNAIANQRMSQSRTSLDDNEYITRFNRLNGAINNLSFNIRKDWQTLPPWLVPYVSTEAIKTGKQEMTAVGRAVITRWLVDEIFNRCFHPGLDPELSRSLKMIEQNIRHFSYTLNSQEEYDALTSKVVSWRMATLEGLSEVLRSGESANNKMDFTRRATSNLTAWLFQHLTDPPPAGVDGSASMIVELAVGIAANLPIESRDVAVTYPLPESPIQPELMEIEKTGLPALEQRPSDASEDGGAADDGGKDGGAGKDGGKEQRGRGDKSRAGLLSVMSSGGSTPGSRKGSVVDTAVAQQQAAQQQLPPKDASKVRFAGFVAVEVRGRQVLVKAPVWTLG